MGDGATPLQIFEIRRVVNQLQLCPGDRLIRSLPLKLAAQILPENPESSASSIKLERMKSIQKGGPENQVLMVDDLHNLFLTNS